VTDMKYRMVSTFLNVVKGSSTGLAPNQVSSKITVTNIQNVVFLVGENFLFREFFFNTRISRITIEATMATTPPILEGIDRKIA